MIEVAGQTLYQQRGHLDLPDDRVATAAQQAAHSPRRVAVVHDQDARGGVTEKASAVLRLVHFVGLLRREPVLPLEPGTEVLLSGGLRVRPTPLSQSLVPPLTIRLSILAVAAACALATLATSQPPIREGVGGQISGALSAVGHTSSMPCGTITRTLDQPCHADVLLELANAEVLP